MLDPNYFSRLFPGITECSLEAPVGRAVEMVAIDYVNHKKERAWRAVLPRRLYFGSSPWHEGEQWLLDAFDVGKGAERTFALADIKEWRRPQTPPEGGV